MRFVVYTTPSSNGIQSRVDKHARETVYLPLTLHFYNFSLTVTHQTGICKRFFEASE